MSETKAFSLYMISCITLILVDTAPFVFLAYAKHPAFMLGILPVAFINIKLFTPLAQYFHRKIKYDR